MSERRYWIGVVAQDHVEAAVAHGFVQLNYGRAAPLARMQPGDGRRETMCPERASLRAGVPGPPDGVPRCAIMPRAFPARAA